MAISNRHALRMDLLFMLFLLITEVEFWIGWMLNSECASAGSEIVCFDADTV